MQIAQPRYDAVLFDLLTALLDSWSLWNAIAGSPEAGRRWRAEYLRITYQTGAYRDYDVLVAEAAEAVGLSPDLAAQLSHRYSELQPWPGVQDTLRQIESSGIPLGIVTNCSEKLGRIAADRLGINFSVIVTAERAGFYKPDPRPYRLALEELKVDPHRCLFVAGSPFDHFGTAKVALPTYWHDRIGMTAPEGTPTPLFHAPTLDPLLPLVLNL
jgi:2-haloacid dehalogenase